MKILFLHSSSDLYGASKILLVTIDILRRNGHIPIVVLSAGGPLAEELENRQVEIIYLKLGILRRKYMHPAGIYNRIHTLYKAVQTLKKIIRQEKIDLVYSNTTAVLAGAFAARQAGVRHIWHVHEIIEKPAFLFRILSYLLKQYSEKIIVVSGAVKKHWSRYVPEEKLALIYNGIDYTPYLSVRPPRTAPPDRQNETGKGIIIGMIGRVHAWKGQDYFLNIAGELIRQFPELQFVMAGDAFPGNEYLYEALEQQKTRLHLTHAVTDLGYRTDIPELLHNFDIFVSPSTSPDPFPTVVLEAMASACAVVATAHGGVTEMITQQVEGILIPRDDAAAAAAMMAPLITDASLRQQLGKAASEKVQTTYSMEAFERKLINVL
ncbi:MAG TPA: glycosyltransferase family 4 protein [Sediminibacterium sp.]|nr:glycosyltransferase family 4 protein [Sediminibacterium sp.]